jgi:Holliday junction resolvase
VSIELPFPPHTLSGHASGNSHWKKTAITKEWRERARIATNRAEPCVPLTGDIKIAIHFIPPDRRGDRVNFPNRMKPIFDGIADALGVNDSRFLPSYHFHAPEKPGAVIVEVE